MQPAPRKIPLLQSNFSGGPSRSSSNSNNGIRPAFTTTNIEPSGSRLAHENEFKIPEIPWRAVLKGNDLLAPYNDINRFPLRQTVDGALRSFKIEQINALQRCSWPHIFRGRNCFIVGGTSDKNGKTLSYLVPIAAKVIRDFSTKPKKPEYGPVGIILCSSTRAAGKIETQLNILFDRLAVTVYRGSKSDTKFKDNLDKNPDFIICKPAFLLFIMTKYSRFFGFTRLRYFVVDDSHLLFQDHFEEVNEIMEVLSHDIEQTVKRAWPIQFVFCGQEWNETLHHACTNTFSSPVLIIGSFMQALVYGKVKIEVSLLKKEEKYEALTELITRGSSKYLVVVCQTRAGVVKLGVKLYRSNGISARYLEHEERSQEQIKRLKNEWNTSVSSGTSKMTVFIVTDDDLVALELKSVTTLVHFEMPVRKSDAFFQRHICMWDLFPNLHVDADLNVEVQHILTSYIYLEPKEEDLFKIVCQLKYIDADIPPELEKLAVEVMKHDMEANLELRSANMCMGIKLFGKCSAPDKLKCERNLRHFFTREILEADSSVPAFQNGRVELRIIECFEVNYYLAQLLNFYQVKEGSKTNNVSYMNILRRRHDALTKFYDTESNRKPLTNFAKQAMCGIKFEGEEYQGYTRAKIVDIMNIDRDGYPFHYRLWCVDIGEHQLRPPDALYVLPDEYINMSQMTISVIVADMKPLGGEDEFQGNKNGRRGFGKDIVKNKIMTAIVALSIEDTIWVKSLFEYQKNTDGEWIQNFNVKTEFVNRRRLAEPNPNHLASLYELCENEGFDCGIYKALESVGTEFQSYKDPIRWAFMRTCSPDDPVITVAWTTFVVSPDSIYVVQNKYVDLLDKLILEMNQEITLLIEEQYPNYESRFLNHYETGLCIAAKDDDGRWTRALITDVFDGENGNPIFDVFFVDHGDSSMNLTLHEVFPIPRKFVARLPFQAVALRLNHVEPENINVEMTNDPLVTKRVWSCSATDYTRNQLVSEGGCVKVDVVALNKNSEKSAEDPKCAYYDAYVFITRDLGEELVENQYAKYKAGALHDYETTKGIMLERLSAAVASTLNEGNSDDEDDGPVFENLLEDVEDDEDDAYEVSLGNDPTVVATMLETLGIVSNPMEKPSSTTGTSQAVCTRVSAGNSRDAEPTSPAAGANTPVMNTGAINETGLKSPIVQWNQLRQNITLKVCIPDIKKYQFQVEPDKRTLSFESIEPPLYGFKIKTWAKVVPTVHETLLGQYLVIKLDKLSPMKWCQLQQSGTKVWWLKRDTERLGSSDEDSDNDCAEHETNYFAHRNRAVTNEERLPAPVELDIEGSGSSDSDDNEFSETEDMAGVE